MSVELARLNDALRGAKYRIDDLKEERAALTKKLFRLKKASAALSQLLHSSALVDNAEVIFDALCALDAATEDA